MPHVKRAPMLSLWQCLSSAPVPLWAHLAALGGSTLPGGEAAPLGAQLLPRVLELAASVQSRECHPLPLTAQAQNQSSTLSATTC